MGPPRRRVGVAAVWYLPLHFSSGDAGLYAPLSLGVALSELLGFGRAQAVCESGYPWKAVARGAATDPSGRLVQFLEASRSHTVTVESCAAASLIQCLRVCVRSQIISCVLVLEIAAEFEIAAAHEAFLEAPA